MLNSFVMKWLYSILKYVVGIMVVGAFAAAVCVQLMEWSHDSSFLSILLAFLAPYPHVLICMIADIWDKIWGLVLKITGCLVQLIVALGFVIDVPLDEQSPFMPALAGFYIVLLIVLIVLLIKNRKSLSIK